MINLNTGEGVNITILPDKQPHVEINENELCDDYCSIVCSLDNDPCVKLIELCMVVDILKRNNIKFVLHIPYLLGARWDRVMPTSAHSFDLKVIANIINSLKADIVFLYDPHSDVASAVIENSVVIDNEDLVIAYNEKDSVLIVPDAGAAKKAHKYAEWNKNITDVVYCIKHRDLSTGNITLKVLEPEKCTDRNCVIIDDICDGGGTFLSIASQIVPTTLTLIVTHGIFSKGYDELGENFDQIIVSNSRLLPQPVADFVKIIDL